MTKTQPNAITDPRGDVPFWFAVFSPVLGRRDGEQFELGAHSDAHFQLLVPIEAQVDQGRIR
jgi:hypothetical protein